jgi:hypothetical protein
VSRFGCLREGFGSDGTKLSLRRPSHWRREQGGIPCMPVQLHERKKKRPRMATCCGVRHQVPGEIWKDWPPAFELDNNPACSPPKASCLDERHAVEMQKRAQGVWHIKSKRRHADRHGDGQRGIPPQRDQRTDPVERVNAPQTSGGFGKGLNNRIACFPEAWGNQPIYPVLPGKRKVG